MKRLLMVAFSLALAATAVQSAAAPNIPIVADVDDHPRYAYNYAVDDPLTRDNKAQWETRDGDAVKGSYQLIEPDGSLRVVDYASNHLTGFKAVVKNVLPNIHPSTLAANAVVPVVAPLAVTAPIVANTVAPLTSIVEPLNYGFGAAPINVGLPHITSLGRWSLPWDALTHSYGGWVPLSAPLLPLPIGPHATIFSKKYVNGRLHKWVTGPIPLIGNTLVFRKKH